MRRIVIALALVAISLRADLVDDLLRARRLWVPEPQESNPFGDPPPATAPLSRLIGYWAQAFRGTPDAATREKLTAAIEQRPDLLPNLVKHLPVNADVCARVKLASDHETAVTWLTRNCATERERLREAASHAREEQSWVEGSEDLDALVAADWNAARPELERHAASGQPRLRAFAMARLFARDGLHRGELQAIAADPDAPATARNEAILALGSSEWDGRDAWLIALMRDPSLANLSDNHQSFAPFEELAGKRPDHWIPILIGLVGNEDRNVHNVAANALAAFNLKTARADALQTLLPWLTDPDWAASPITTPHPRLRIIQSVADLGLRETIPALLHVVAHDADDANRAHAAEALRELGAIDIHAHAALRQGLDKSGSFDLRMKIAGVLVENGGVEPAELARDLEIAVKAPEDLDFDEIKNHAPAEVIGAYVRSSMKPRDDVAAAILAHARTVDPVSGADMREVVMDWPVPAVLASTIAAIADNTADADTIVATIEVRTQLPREPLRELTRGVAAGIAAVLLADEQRMRSILGGGDAAAQRALLAAARIARQKLPLAAVEKLFTGATARAAEVYLRGDDTREARAMIRAKHPGELLILGHRWDLIPGDDEHEFFDEWERDLVRRFLASNAKEVFAFASESSSSDDPKPVEIFLHEHDPEWTKFAATYDDLGPLNLIVSHGTDYEYVHLTRTGGRRVFMTTPSFAPASPQEELMHRFQKLAR